jgi:hypothetical protein
MVNRHYSTFHIAGFTYWDGLDVFDKLRIGTELTLEAEPTNGHDPYAVKILLGEAMLGYIPRGENKEISKFLQLGHTDLFTARVSQIDPETHPERQVHVTVKIQ